MTNIKINYLHLCDAANTDSLGKVSILGIFSKIFLPQVPSKFPKFTVVCSLSFKKLEEENNKIEIKVFGPKKEELKIDPPINLEFRVDKQNLEKNTDINLILEMLNLEFLNFGEHNLNIILNGETIGKKSFLAEERRVN